MTTIAYYSVGLKKTQIRSKSSCNELRKNAKMRPLSLHMRESTCIHELQL